MVLDLDACIDSLFRRQLLAESVIKEICEKTKELLMNESNVVHIKAPVTVVGDIHGYPDRVQLVRGNHESRAVTQTYGFYTECMKKYGSAQVWNYFTDLFDYLTLSVVIDNMIFCVHGEQIKVMDRFREIPHEGPMADLVWSDPDPGREEFAVSPRGAGYTFGSLVVEKFLHENKMEHILRAHQLCMEGFQVLFDDQLSTVWSAPNYCYRCGNLASILEVGVEGERHFNVFEAAPENERPAASEAQRALFSNGVPTGLFGNGTGVGGVSNGIGGNSTTAISYLNSNGQNGMDPAQDTILYFL
ncbi:putative serine/threonine protein phosphatase [Entomortierella beljakovae]|nr:putative serine/threonine protein phosphatase [Entomortierella beljakovae]